MILVKPFAQHLNTVSTLSCLRTVRGHFHCPQNIVSLVPLSTDIGDSGMCYFCFVFVFLNFPST